jgi:hypothetical protein
MKQLITNPLSGMQPLQRSQFAMACVALFLALATAAYAQVSSINSVIILPRVFDDIPGATGTQINGYPGFISLSEAGVSQTTGGFANRDVWFFSNDHGVSPYQFQDNDYFATSFSVILTDSADSPRKEAGFLFRDLNGTFPGGDLQFIVDSDGHEVVQFGGFSFFAFAPAYVKPYVTGTTIRLGMAYFQLPDGNNAFLFSANGRFSPIFELPPGVGIGNGNTLGGYFQIDNDPSSPGNAGKAVFRGISIISASSP